MDIATYKGYKIQFYDSSGQFSIDGLSGRYEKYKDATAKIDRVVKAEVKGNFPIDAVLCNTLKVGKITSYNSEEEVAWFSSEDGDRGKHSMIDYGGKPRFFKATEFNLNLARQHKELSDKIIQIQKEQRQLEKSLTAEPITFDEAKP